VSNSKSLVVATILAVTTPLYAGVEMDLVTTDPDGAVTESVKLYAQSGKIRMQDIGDTSGQEMSMIFVGQEFIVVDHDDKSYIVMDEAMVQEMGVKVNAAMEQMRAQLADMPPEQRAMVEQMMQGQMAGMMGSEEESNPTRVEQTGSGSWQSGPCTEYTVFEGDQKTQQICAAPLGEVEGADEAMAAFENMAKFINSLAESMPGPLGESMAENPMGLIDQIDGFPVRTVDYVDGQVSSETTLSSVADSDLDPALFAIPEGYTQQDPFAGK
jgi:hypothetical protein